MERVCVGASAEQTGGMQDAQTHATFTRAEGVSREPFGSFSLY